jgi:acetyltransferase-like isoleucine patch superfamily enzyme
MPEREGDSVTVEPLLANRGFAAMTDVLVREHARITDLEIRTLLDRLLIVEDAATLSRLGIRIVGDSPCKVAVTSIDGPVGNVILKSVGDNNFFVIDNDRMAVEANIAVRFVRSQSVAFFAAPIGGILNIPDLFMRSSGQWLYWGEGATAVGVRISIEGEEHGVAVGDDCMISSDVGISNHDMHTLFDIETEEIVNEQPVDVLLEQHVWLGESARLLGTERVGFGSVVAGGAFMKGAAEPMTVVGGVPAKLIRSGTSWSRPVRDVEHLTLDRLNRLRQLDAD